MSVCLDSGRRAPVDHAKHAAPLLGLSNNHLHWIGGRAENIGYLRHCLDAAQHIDRKTIAQGDYENVSGADRGCVLDSILLE